MKLNLFFLPITLLILVLFPVIYFWIYFLPQKWQVTISRIPVKIWCKTVFISFGIKLHYHGETTLKKKPLVILSDFSSPNSPFGVDKREIVSVQAKKQYLTIE